jgi:hypothetical protein
MVHPVVYPVDFLKRGKPSGRMSSQDWFDIRFDLQARTRAISERQSFNAKTFTIIYKGLCVPLAEVALVDNKYARLFEECKHWEWAYTEDPTPYNKAMLQDICNQWRIYCDEHLIL